MKAGMYNMRQLVHLCSKIFDEKKEKSQEDMKLGRKARPLREYVVSAIYSENELSTQMMGDLMLNQLLNVRPAYVDDRVLVEEEPSLR